MNNLCAVCVLCVLGIACGRYESLSVAVNTFFPSHPVVVEFLTNVPSLFPLPLYTYTTTILLLLSLIHPRCFCRRERTCQPLPMRPSTRSTSRWTGTYCCCIVNGVYSNVVHSVVYLFKYQGASCVAGASYVDL